MTPRYWMMRLGLLVALGCAVTTGFTATAHAQCASLQPHVKWLKDKPNGSGDYRLVVTLASNSGTGMVRYARGELALNAAGTQLTGTLRTLRSTDTWEWNVCSAPDPDDGPVFPPDDNHPFSPDEATYISMTMNAVTGAFTFGNDSVASVDCSVMMIRGQGNVGFIVRTFYILALKQSYIQVPT